MVESQEHAQAYHRGRFGEMTAVPFASVPAAERPLPYIRGKSRTDW